MTRRPHIPHIAIVRAPGLLPMLYTVAELSRELEIPDRTLRDWLDIHGVPHQRDKRGHIWVNGRQFASWVKSMRKPSRTAKLLQTQAYCMKCNQVVEIENPTMVNIKGKLVNIRGHCSRCGCTVNRGQRLATNPSIHLPITH